MTVIKMSYVRTLRGPSPVPVNLVTACVASVSSRVIARKLEREQKKNERGRGRGEEETLARKPYDSAKRPGSVHL